MSVIRLACTTLGVTFLTFLGGREGVGHIAKRQPYHTIARVRWPVTDFT